jgi:UDP-N-acetylmuramate dehydrogenase
MLLMSAPAEDFPRLFLEAVGKPVQERVPLRNYSNFRIGGPADYFFEATALVDLKSAIHSARACGVAFHAIGGGFNLLFDDNGFRGLILKNSVRGVTMDDRGTRLEAASGTPIGDLVDFALAESLEGFEFLAGIPGTVGGAVFGNAGAFGECIGDCLEEAVLLGVDGAESRVQRIYFAFAYRHSRLKLGRDILLEAKFRLRPGRADRIKAKIAENLAVRAEKHPPRDTAYAGSYFKNPTLPDGTRAAAGLLLEQAGAKDLKIGGAAVYPGHCNLLLNTGGATARDILVLAAELKERVKDKFGIELEEEVMFLPARASGL